MPNKDIDKAKLRDMLYPALKNFSGKVRFHFFLSDLETKSVAAGSNTLVNRLPKEIGNLVSATGGIEVGVFFSNNTGKVNKAELDKALQFYNSALYPPSIIYTSTDL